MDEDRKTEIINSIASGIAPKVFPGDFIGSDYEGETTVIPKGKEVSMYRELEGVFVMIDGQRLFFNNPAYAKFIFYCAKAGLTNVKVPEAKLAKKAVKGLEQEIATVNYEIEKRLNEYSLSEMERREFAESSLEKLNLGYYTDIVSSEDLW